MVQNLTHGLAHAGGRADHAVEAGQRHHLENIGNAAAFLTHQPAHGASQLRFGRRIGHITHFVFQLLNLQGVFAAVRAPARHQKTGNPALCLRQNQECVTHGCRHKIFVSHQLIDFATAPLPNRIGAGAVGTHIGAALFFCHGHANGHTAFLRGGHIARIVTAAGDEGLPDSGEGRLLADGGDGGEGHGNGATVAGFHLRLQIEQCGTIQVLAGALVGPGAAVNAVDDGGLHQLVIRRMKFDLIHSPAIAVVAAELRFDFVGLKAPLDHFGGTGELAEGGELHL